MNVDRMRKGNRLRQLERWPVRFVTGVPIDDTDFDDLMARFGEVGRGHVWMLPDDAHVQISPARALDRELKVRFG